MQHYAENITRTTCLVKCPAAVAVASYPDIVVELLVTKGGPTDVFVVEPPALGLAHMAHVREFCLAFFRGFRNNCRETLKVFTMYIILIHPCERNKTVTK